MFERQQPGRLLEVKLRVVLLLVALTYCACEKNAQLIDSIIFGEGESPSITVLYPNGSEHFEPDLDEIDIRWIGGNFPEVTIELYRGSTFDQPISASTPNDGSYNWQIPSGVAERSDYRIKILSNTDANKYDFSDASFTIGTVPTTVIFPSSGTTLEPGFTYPIIYRVSNSHYRISIELFNNNQWLSTIFSREYNDGFAEWSISTSLGQVGGYQIGITKYYSPYNTLGFGDSFALGALPRGTPENHENNDSAGLAYGPLQVTTQYISYISPTGDEDWYYFQLDRLKKVTLYLIVPGGRDYNLLLLDESQGQLSLETGYGGNQDMSIDLMPGMYYVKIVGVGGSADGINPYVLLLFAQI